MNINSTKFKDLKILKLKRFIDLRGNLVKTINKNYKSLKFNCFESYISISKKGAGRGLHGQLGKYSQSKIIYCVQGKFLDIAVDLRINSKTYGKVFKKIINSKNSEALLIPKGFAHGVVVLENNTILLNYSSSAHKPKQEYGINIKSINLNLGKLKLIISKKDKSFLSLNKFLKQKK